MTEKIAIIDYGSGNLRSAHKAFAHVVALDELDAHVFLTDKADDVAQADRIVLPGQGAFGDCMYGLKSVDGMVDALQRRVIDQGAPFFGICVGMQLMATRGLEHGEHEGLNWIEGDVIPIAPGNKNFKIPHMGWNETYRTADHFMVQSITKKDADELSHFYFVHSFMMQCKNPAHVLAMTHYSKEIAAIIGRDNMIGIQCHPEKSQKDGLEIIRRFLKWKP